MKLNWNLFVGILSPILGVIFGVIIDRYFKEKPNLMTYLSHTSAIYTKAADGKDLKVHTHSVVIQNLGRKPSKNVRIGHYVLPSFSIYPSIDYNINSLPDGTKEIHFPAIIPKEIIYINYLYFPPIVWQNINKYTKSDEGFAKRVNMQFIPIYSKSIKILSTILVTVGLISSIYLFVQLISWVIRSFI